MKIEITIKFPDLESSLNRLITAVETIARRFRPVKPGPMFIEAISQGADHMLAFKVKLPTLATTPDASDVVKRSLTVTAGGLLPQPVTITDVAATEITQDDAGNIFKGEDQDAVLCSLTDTDAHGNVSEPREESFTLTDTIAPPQPGEFGLEVTGQVA